ncbi:N-acetyltransferase ESCO2 isoform X1 [Alligator mississippiensis]|uniref:N-acetyltransferase ESCO2 isoform X1 n=2 Tax=Alligator mississippiensis TaxID=8496 RepID=UPI0009074F8E|nr:N-acetyltransferase ESCO2 isoform X1 [Alligator mississippiensis]XP_019348758.1 N-acetyltransferase ESCO2 isoform X1 [Alligator mississippiensis]
MAMVPAPQLGSVRPVRAPVARHLYFRCSGKEMAAVTPRKRNRSSTTPDGALLALMAPVKKLMRDFGEGLSPAKSSTDHSFASQKKNPRTSRDEDKENQTLPLKSSSSRDLENSPLQTASVPKAACWEFPSKVSPKSGSTYKSVLPAASFYSKEKWYLTPLERKLVKEIRPFSQRNNDGNLPTANKTEKVQVNVKRVRNTSSKASRHPKAVAKTSKKAKLDTVPVKSEVEKKSTNGLVEKKTEDPFRVLSMKVKPMLKLQMGAAFFSTGRKSHSGPKKLPSAPRSLQPLSRSAAEDDQAGLLANAKVCSTDENKIDEASKESKHASGLQKDDQEGVTSISQKDAVCEVEAPLQKINCTLASPSGSSKPLTPGDVDSNEIGSSITCELDDDDDDEIIPSSQSPSENKKAGFIYPIFSTFSSNKKRPQPHPDDLASSLRLNPPVTMAHTMQKNSKKTKDLSRDSKAQMIIDAGQKHFGAVVCKSCGMIYTAASPEDEAQHIQHHQRFLEGLKYVSWKRERVVAEFWDGKIVLVLPDDPKYAIRKAEEVRELVDNELGFKQVVLRCPAKIKTYLFVSSEKKIVGCLVAEHIRQAFRVLSEPHAPQSPNQGVLEYHRAWRCSTKPEPAICGISRIWVFSLMRRRSIARRMVDVVRNTFIYGCYLSTAEIAFSDPTPDGKLFATKYCQTPNFLVYNFIS